ncbi:MAG: multifunctional oxoglutarate decarboxylase/oxoglutarate dehydrogenase thiamine pyrophosphate-binding subunit/dihydrolipoyllysine-residue succinyltransferase subunit [Gemmatimonadales bacterium]
MSAPSPDPNVFETANAGFAQALYEEFLRDPGSVGPEWRRLFESGRVGVEPPPAPPPPPTNGASGDGAGPSRDGGAPGAVALKGPAARLAANMEESLSVPTATTFREISVRALERQRSALNRALKTAGKDVKLSFTHLIGYALVQAARQHPGMVISYRSIDGAPHRIEPDGVHLGLAVDVERKDGSRGLVVPVLKRAETMSFAEFHAAYEGLVDKARNNRLMPDDFAGANITLTNPGGLGTVASVPRLMAGQASIIAVGAIGYPPEYYGLSNEHLAEIGVSKVMMITSTYDHRVIQGAESGEFLRTLESHLQDEAGFFAGIARELGLLGAGPHVEPGDRELPGGEEQPRPSIAIPMPMPPGFRPSAPAELAQVAAAMGLVKAFRTHGHLAAHLDPLGSAPIGDPALDPDELGLTPDIMARIPAQVLRVAVPGATLADALPRLQETYCGTIAYEVEHIASHEERVWLRAQIEAGTHRAALDPEARVGLYQRLIDVDAFEKFLHKAYLGQKRFSIEGVDLLVPILDQIIEAAADDGARDVVIGMAHRGRLNVLAHTVGRPYATIIAEFEGKQPAAEGEDEGTGDVKYHHGAEGAVVTRTGRSLTVTLAHNPSHLEFVGPVVDGRARARQTVHKGGAGYHDASVALPVVIHGDAAFAGQGVVQETLNLGALRGYGTGGTIHIIANNQIGFTTDAIDSRSTRYASDLAKGFDIPIIHVNADDPEACLAAARLAMLYRARFANDVLIDLVGYRRHGHNEADEPAYTQPRLYEVVRRHPSVRELYAERLIGDGLLSDDEAEARFQAAYQHLVDLQQGYKASLNHPGGTEATLARVTRTDQPVTGVPAELLLALNDQLLSVPDGFTVHPKLARQLERRRVAVGPEGGIDWGHAESLAFASLLTEGVPLRLTGQDTERGTFSHRHLVLHDAKTGSRFCPAQSLPGSLASFEVHNSPLSELATLGFEYGYSTASTEVLVVWEAQFGDFINGAQVIVDQFIVAGWAKWGVTSRLTLLLPHGYEGQGPEHSSARLERFLQLSAESNIHVANCTTAAQYFHLLRHQALRSRQRPLVVFTPKSLLRLPQACSTLDDLVSGSFHAVLDDPVTATRAESVGRLVLCSGKVYYDLLAEAEPLGEARPAIARIERLYSFPEDDLRALIASYPSVREVVWCQEEPMNMGAWTFVSPRLEALLPDGATLRYVGRPNRASPAEGYHDAHVVEQARIVRTALGG